MFLWHASPASASVLFHYRFESGIALDPVVSLVDSGPNGLHGTVGSRSPAITYSRETPGTVDSGELSLNASGDGNFGHVGNHAILRPAGDFTLELYVRADSPHSGSHLDGDEVVVMKNDELGTSIVSYGIGYSHQAASFFTEIDITASTGAGGALYHGSGPVAPNTWHHIALVFDENGANDTYSMYTDHVLTGTMTGNFPVFFDAAQANPFVIGAGNFGGNPNGSFRRNFGGDIDEVRLSDQALTPSGFLAPVAPLPSGVLVHYRFETGPDSAEVGAIFDSGPFGLHGAAGGRAPAMAYTIVTPGTPADGEFALEAGADGDYGVGPNSPILRPWGDFTLELYARPETPYTGSNADGDLIVACKNDELGTSIVSYGIGYDHGTGAFYTQIDTDPATFSGGSVFLGSGPVTTNAWHHVALVFDENGGSDTYSMYTDHVLTGTVTGNLPIFFDPAQANAFVIGAGNFGGDPNGPFRRNFGGDIDEIRLTAQALTPVEFLPSAGSVDVPGRGLPATLEFGTVHPNPSRGTTRFAFTLPSRVQASLRIVDVQGRAIRRLVDRPLGPGEHSALWDGRDESGRTMGTGVYFVELSDGRNRVHRRVVIIR